MKTLLLVRHAKSSWDDAKLPDRERRLAERGRHDAPKMGKRVAERRGKPDLLLSSPAHRAQETAEIFARKLGYEIADIALDERLYPGAARDVIEVIRALDDRFEYVMLVGHNPGLSDLAHSLAPGILDLPTCAVAEFAFDVDSWSAVGQVKPARIALDTPKKRPENLAGAAEPS